MIDPLYHMFSFKENLISLNTGTFPLGGNYRSYNPNSRGTIFSDTNGIKLQVSELGFFSGYSKETEKVSMNVTLRLDKNQNFSWLASPAMSMVYRPNNKTVLRIGASSAIRNPTLQDQYLYYNVGRAILVGNLTGYDSLITISEVGDFFRGRSPRKSCVGLELLYHERGSARKSKKYRSRV